MSTEEFGLGRVKSATASLASLLESGRFMPAAERELLERHDFYIVGAKPRHDSGAEIGEQALFAIVCPDLWGSERRVLGLGYYRSREDFARSCVAELRDADALGPFQLERVPTRTGHEWVRFKPAASDADRASG